MSNFYHGQRKKNLFDPALHGPGRGKFPLSRSKLELYLRCPHCFYLDRRLGVGEPPGYPFNLNSAVDHLLKKEFDEHRRAGTPHPMFETHGIKALPFAHADLDRWRHNFSGVRYVEPETNLEIFGAVDDVWVGEDGALHVVDYKSTSKESEINLDADWQRSYKNQAEIYQWLLKNNGFPVSPVAYFVYANARRGEPNFNDRLVFDTKIIPYEGNSSWVDEVVAAAYKTLITDAAPAEGAECDLCRYRSAAQTALEK